MAKTILVVDDSASFRQVVALTLKGAGYDVVEGAGGTDALTKLDGRKIHLIISDVDMPDMDGLAFFKQVKARANCKFAPVIMLSTEGQEARRQEGRAAGAKTWITKPFTPPQVLDAVAKLVLP